MNDHGGWTIEGRCVFCGANRSSTPCGGLIEDWEKYVNLAKKKNGYTKKQQADLYQELMKKISELSGQAADACHKNTKEFSNTFKMIHAMCNLCIQEDNEKI